jgi:hypothetical protein
LTAIRRQPRLSLLEDERTVLLDHLAVDEHPDVLADVGDHVDVAG